MYGYESRWHYMQSDCIAEMLEVKRYSKNVHVEEFIPNVIEPSFGIGRIMYCVFEHTFRQRAGDEQRTYLAIPPALAPYKCSVLPLSKKSEFDPYLRRLCKHMSAHTPASLRRNS